MGRLAALAPSDWALVLALAGLAAAARLGVLLLSLPKLMGLVALGAENGLSRRLAALPGRPAPSRLAALVDLAAWSPGGRGRCLARSIALYGLMRARREPAELLVGVARAGGSLEGHAWVESRGEAIGEASEVIRRYAVVARL